MAYEYKMLQMPPDITVKMKEQRGNEAAAYLESIANSQAANGWEFYRVDEVGVLASPGCFGAFFGRKSEYTLYYVVTFRRNRLADDDPPQRDKSSQPAKQLTPASSPGNKISKPAKSVGEKSDLKETNFLANDMPTQKVKTSQPANQLRRDSSRGNKVSKPVEPAGERSDLKEINFFMTMRDIPPQQSTANFCYHCGADLPEKTKTCPECGKAL